jgi:hypothetical protein
MTPLIGRFGTIITDSFMLGMRLVLLLVLLILVVMPLGLWILISELWTSGTITKRMNAWFMRLILPPDLKEAHSTHTTKQPSKPSRNLKPECTPKDEPPDVDIKI